MSNNLNSDKALIFRIVHCDNLPWILENGLHAKNGGKLDPTFRNIGNPDLIDKRSRRIVPIPPGGTLSDYVPFYFTLLDYDVQHQDRLRGNQARS